MSEALDPPTVVEIINSYLTLTTECIMKNHGTLDKFVGDCTMAAVTDLGFAQAFLKQLCKTDGEQYAQALAQIEQKQEKIARRKVQKGKKGQSKSNGMRRTNI